MDYQTDHYCPGTKSFSDKAINKSHNSDNSRRNKRQFCMPIAYYTYEVGQTIEEFMALLPWCHWTQFKSESIEVDGCYCTLCNMQQLL